MKKVFVFFAVILSVIFIAYACKMPNSIEFRSDNFEMNTPVKIGRFNVATVLSEVLKSSFPEGFEIYDIVDYADAQAFLIGYEMDLSESFNPDDYLDDIRTHMGKMNGFAADDNDPVTSDPIIIPSMTTKPLENDDWHFFEMDGFFQTMQNQINDHSNPPIPIPYFGPPGMEPALAPDFPPPFMVFKGGGGEGDGGTPNFEAVFVHEGEIVLNIWLEDLSHTDIEVTLSAIEMKGSVSGSHIGTPASSQSATVTSSNDENNPVKITITIDGKTIERGDPPKFHLGNITSTSSAPSIDYKLYVQPEIKGKGTQATITLEGAEALRIGRSEEDVPEDIVKNIEMQPIDNMLDAKIKTGNFRITADPPHSDPDDPIPPLGTTYCRGMNIGYRIVLEQAPVSIPGYPQYNFNSLNATFNKEDPSQADPSLAGKWISGNDLIVNECLSKIIITADPDTGATFRLHNDFPELPYDNKLLPIKIDMGLNIYELEKVHWKTKNDADEPILPPVDVPPIDFGTSPVMRSITFSEMKLNVDFTKPEDPPLPPSSGLPEELKSHLALKVSCPALGFNDVPANTKILEQDENQFIGNPPKLYADEHPHINFDVKLLPVVDGIVRGENFPYMEFGELDMSDGEDKELGIYAEISMDYQWIEAEIDLQAALKKPGRDDPTGMYPENTKDPIDLSDLGKYMQGITFGGGIEAKVFLGGPRKLIEKTMPRLDFSAQWEDDDLEKQVEPLLIKCALRADEELPKLPGKDSRGEWVYSSLSLPEPDRGFVLTGSFSRIFASFPRNLRFSYEMTYPDAASPLTVYPDTFDDVEEGEDSTLKALLVLLLPMEFIAEPGGYFAVPDLFKEGKDLFGREEPHEPSVFTGVNIKKLGIKLDFGYSFLSGSHLHFDRDDMIFGEDGLPLGGDTSVKVTFNGAQQSMINENLIYPDIKFVFPERRELRIGRYALPLRIVVSASGSYTLDVDDLGLEN